MSRDCIVTSRLKDRESRYLDMLVRSGKYKSRSDAVRALIRSDMMRYDQRNGSNWLAKDNTKPEPDNTKKEHVSTLPSRGHDDLVKRSSASISQVKVKSQETIADMQAMLAKIQRSHENMLIQRRYRQQ